MKKYILGDYLLIWAIMILGLAEIMHGGALFLGWSVSCCSKLFAVGLGGLLVTAIGFTIHYGRTRKISLCPNACYAWYMPFVILAVSQIAFICLGNGTFRNGDMMVETVGSFLVNDGVYMVNPMTGNPYTAGIPLRLEILGLPTLYSMFCCLTGAEPVFMVQKVIPVCVVLLSYAAFSVLGDVLFEKRTRGKAIFMALVALLLWAGAYMYGMDGFNLLCCGWRGVTIRNLVLIPWLISLCMRKLKFGILSCLAAEVCIVWTLYGLGMCLVVTVGMVIAGILAEKYMGPAKEQAEKEGRV